MNDINDILKRNNILGCKYKKNGKCIIVNNKEKNIVIKPNKTNIYEYLNYRNFNNFPNIFIDNGYEIIEYIEPLDIPVEQKMIDLINIVSSLHKKTTYYKKISEFNIDDIYSDISKKIEDVKLFYDKLLFDAENSIYMSPSNYLLVRNISSINFMINTCETNMKKWLDKIKETDKIRVSVIHNNLNLNHFINNTLISWDKSKIGLPIFDLYILYTNTYNEYDWNELLDIYINNYPLKEDELFMFYTLIGLPLKPNLTNIEIDNVKEINEKLNYLKLSKDLISKRKFETNKKNE